MSDRKPPGLEGLTERQTEILRLAARHWARKEIAGQLNISERTVKHHMTMVRQHLGVATDKQAIRILTKYDMPGTVQIGQFPNETVAESPDATPRSRHEPDTSRPDSHSLPAGFGHVPVSPEGSGGCLEGDGDAGENAGGRRWPESDADRVSNLGAGKGRLQSGVADRLFNERGAGFSRWLKRLPIVYALLLVIVVAIVLSIGAMTILASGAAMMTGVEKITGQTW